MKRAIDLRVGDVVEERQESNVILFPLSINGNMYIRSLSLNGYLKNGVSESPPMEFEEDDSHVIDKEG